MYGNYSHKLFIQENGIYETHELTSIWSQVCFVWGQDKTADFKWDKTADFENETKPPISKMRQNRRFRK